MGAAPSLDAEMADVKQISVDFTAAFGKNYAKFYTIGLAKKQLAEKEKEAKGPSQWKLLEYDGKSEPPNRKEGLVLKRSDHLKKWNERYMVVRGDYIVDYYKSEEDYKKNPEKPRGTINLSNRYINRDLNNALIKRVEELAKKVNLDVSALPKPEEFPEHTLSIYHDRKVETYIQCKTAEEHKEWCDMLERCRWNAPRYDINDDPVHHWAFPIALWRTRWEVDMWGWFYGGGGEVDMISSCINEQIMWKVMCRVDEKLTMPWAARSKIRNTFMKSTDAAVSGAVGPGWKGFYEAATKSAPAIEEKLAEAVQPLADAQAKMMKEILGMVESSSKDTLAEKVTPHLAPLLDIVFSPVADSVQLIVKAFDASIKAGHKHYTANEKRNYLIRHNMWTSEFHDAERKIWDLYDPLWAMRKVFDDVSPWRIQNKARTRLRKLIQNALFTFETKIEEKRQEVDASEVTESIWDEVATETRALLVDDARFAILKILGYILFGVVEDMWSLVVIKPARMLVKPLAETLPDAVKEFLDPEDVLEKVLNEILMNCCRNVFSPYADKIKIE